ncbi:MAG TPA: YciI family protein [Actinospica sp.]|jgi:hypothetical protein|nr:YciI family protein [Actinospica sp.]
MPLYMISFDDGAMQIPDAELPEVAELAHGVIREAQAAGVYVFTGGFALGHEEVSVVDTDGTVTDGPFPESKEYLGGLLVVDVPSRDEALKWAAKVAAACRCAQEVREFLHDPEVHKG